MLIAPEDGQRRRSHRQPQHRPARGGALACRGLPVPGGSVAAGEAVQGAGGIAGGEDVRQTRAPLAVDRDTAGVQYAAGLPSRGRPDTRGHHDVVARHVRAVVQAEGMHAVGPGDAG